MKTPPQIFLVPRRKLRPSPLQTRQFFNEEYLNEIAVSLRTEIGFINPLVVRVTERSADFPLAEYEIVAGECRWRASDERAHPTQAGVRLPELEEVPVVLRVLDDAATLRLMLAENMARRDLTPIEECDGFHRALAQVREDGARVYRGYEDLAQAIGVNPETVRQRLSLVKLPAAGRKAMMDGRLSFAVARVICGCPEKIVKEVLACAIDPMKHEVWIEGMGYADEPLTADQVSAVIAERFVRLLDEAPFRMEDEKLLPLVTSDRGERVEGGACVGCAWNTATGAEKPRRGERKKCLNPSCFAKKVERHTAMIVFHAEKAGHTVLQGDEAARILHGSPSATLSYSYVDLDETLSPEEMGPGQKPVKWREVVFGEAESKVVMDRLGEDAVSETVTGDVAVPVTVLIDGRGRPHFVVERKLAVAAASKTGAAVKVGMSAGRGRSAQNEDVKAKRKEEQEAAKRRNEVTFRVVGAALEKLKTEGEMQDVFWRWMCGVAIWHGGEDALHFVAKRRELEGEPREVVSKLVRKTSEPWELRALAVELLLGRLVKFSGVGEEHFRGLCKVIGLDVKAVERGDSPRRHEGTKEGQDAETRGGGEAGTEDELLGQARELYASGEAKSVATLQRKLRLGYTRAKALFGQLVAGKGV